MTLEYYRIANWDELFENNRSRELKNLDWVPIPNKQDGDGYTELLDHKNGAAHLGAWTALLQLASKCETRGKLMRNTGEPHCAASISRRTRIPKEILEEMLPRVLKTGWLEVVNTDCTRVCEIPHDGAGLVRDDRHQNRGSSASPSFLSSLKEKKIDKDSVKEVQEIVEHYQVRHKRSRPGKKEKAKIRDRLGEGYTVEDLKSAIDGCHASPFHQGKNDGNQKYESIELIFRDSSKVAYFIEMRGRSPPVGLKKRTEAYAKAAFQQGLAAELKMARAKGATDVKTLEWLVENIDRLWDEEKARARAKPKPK